MTNEIHDQTKRKPMYIMSKIGCLVLAFFVWLYVMSIDSPTYEAEFLSVPVRIINRGELSVLSGSGTVIDVAVRGKRSVIKGLTSDSIDAYVDISEITEAGRYKTEVEIDLPAGVTLERKSPSTISLYIDNTGAVSVPVEVKLTDSILEVGYELGVSDIEKSISEVTVTGPESELAAVKCARLTVPLGHVTRSVTYSGALELIGNDGEPLDSGSLRLQTTDVTVTVPVYKYRELPLEISFRYGYFNETNSSVTVTPETVTIKGAADAVDDISWAWTLDEKQFGADGEYAIALLLPDGVISVDGVESATISVRHIGTSSKQLNISSFNVINPDGIPYSVNTSLAVTLHGPTALVNYITAASVTATVDLSGQQGTSATVLVPVSFAFSGLYDNNIYELGAYSLAVRLGE